MRSLMHVKLGRTHADFSTVYQRIISIFKCIKNAVKYRKRLLLRGEFLEFKRRVTFGHALILRWLSNIVYDKGPDGTVTALDLESKSIHHIKNRNYDIVVIRISGRKIIVV